MNTAPELHLLRPDDVLFQRLGDEIVLFHLQTDRFYTLNPTAARFWELVTGGLTLAEVAPRMLAEFDVDPAELAQQTEALVAVLIQNELVRVHD